MHRKAIRWTTTAAAAVEEWKSDRFGLLLRYDRVCYNYARLISFDSDRIASCHVDGIEVRQQPYSERKKVFRWIEY